MQIFRPELTKLSNNFLFNANIALQFERKMRYHGNAVHGRLLSVLAFQWKFERPDGPGPIDRF